MEELNESKEIKLHNDIMIYEENSHNGIESRMDSKQEESFVDKYPYLQDYQDVFPENYLDYHQK